MHCAISTVLSVHPFVTHRISQVSPILESSPSKVCWNSESSVAAMTRSSFQAKMPMERKGSLESVGGADVMRHVTERLHLRVFPTVIEVGEDLR